MKLYLNHTERYPVEQLQMQLFASEASEFVTAPFADGENGAVSGLFTGKKYVTATAKISWNGKTGRAAKRLLREQADVRHTRRILQQSYYLAAMQVLDTVPPWGALSGVRPSKLSTKALLAGKTRRQAERELEREFFVTPERAKALIEEKFGAWQGVAGEAFPQAIAIPEQKKLFRDKDTEQVHLCLSFRGTPMGSADVYPATVLNSILGGGNSSRLFQRIREEMGMAYTVYSGLSNYPYCGEFTVYAATSPKHAKAVLEQLDTEIQKLLENGVTEKEFSQAKAQLKGSFILGLESAYNRMSALGHHQILLF